METRPAITNDGDEARKGESDRNITRPKQVLIRGQEAVPGTRSSIVGDSWSEAISIPAIVAGAGLIGLFLAVKVGAKVIGVWPTARAFGLPTRDANYTTLLMSTGLTFGTIAALYGLTNGYIDQPTYTILVTVVILSAVVPTLIATTFFEPQPAGDQAFEDFEAAEEIDAGPLRRAPHPVRPDVSQQGS